MDSKNQDDRICTSRRRFLKRVGFAAIASLPLRSAMVFAEGLFANPSGRPRRLSGTLLLWRRTLFICFLSGQFGPRDGCGINYGFKRRAWAAIWTKPGPMLGVIAAG